ncbi:MAG: mannose-1-phosphate guanylyltransferase/mannose-6-phosphate isomerase [Coxiellaceae bacterium]|nr:mannose-1-phosphate guanylyltransferase/mannose-6-phosphate isomerase [Coxiellaceae bacterium]
MAVIPVILAGGSGTRLWPLSRETYPKQFIKLIGQYSLFQETILRARAVSESHCLYVVCNAENYFICLDQLSEIAINNVYFILEPVGRNTAPAIAMAALVVKAREKEKIVLIMPSDHQIKDIAVFKEAVVCAENIVKKENALVTFGIKPTAPKTGYGYIECGEVIENTVCKIKRFVEKPTYETALQFLKTDSFYWNSGLFLFDAETYLIELQQQASEIYSTALLAYAASKNGDDYIRIDASLFGNCPSNSIDYAVMEKTKNAVIVPLNTEWSDLGCWTAVSEAVESDASGNTVCGEVFLQNTENCYVRSDGRLIAVLGLKDKIIVSTADAILIADKQYAQSVKLLVEEIKKDNVTIVKEHLLMHRPWGSYEILSQGPHFKVKRIMVNPGATLSLQVHQHRAEHWVVVSGVADVINGDQAFSLKANESTYISQNSLHRLSNSQQEMLVIIEVQSGNYLGEDDIKRLDDVYNR